MKILSVQEIILEPGTMKTTSVELDQRKGLFFRFVTSTFETPYFPADVTSVPHRMDHNDRAPDNVELTIEDGTLNIYQGYRQATYGFLFVCANNDWVDEAALTPAVIDMLDVVSITLNNGTEVECTATLVKTTVEIKSKNFTPTASTVYAKAVTLKNGSTFQTGLIFIPHAVSSEPVTYDYISSMPERFYTVYGVNN